MEAAVLVFGVATVLAGVWSLIRHLEGARGPSAWMRSRGNPGVERELQKRAGTLRVAILPYEGDRGEHGLRIVVSGLCPGVSLRREVAPEPQAAAQPLDFGAHMREASATHVGDPRLDAAVAMNGPAALAQALLNAPARAALLAILDDPDAAALQLSQGELAVDVPGYDTPREGDPLRRVGQAVVDAAVLLKGVDDIPARLAAAIEQDPEPMVRAQALGVLAREHASHPLTVPTLRNAARDSHAEVRLRAALALGPEGRPLLVALVNDERSPRDCVLRALQSVGSSLSYDEARVGLERTLAHRHFDASRILLAAVGSLGGSQAVPLLAGTLSRFSGEVGAAAAVALGATKLPETEAPLLAGLEDARDGPRLRAIADALGAVGSRASLAPLRSLLEGHGDTPVGWAAQRALAEILARVGGTPGELSLAAAEAGQLALTDDPGGRVSLERPPRPDEPGE